MFEIVLKMFENVLIQLGSQRSYKKYLTAHKSHVLGKYYNYKRFKVNLKPITAKKAKIFKE